MSSTRNRKWKVVLNFLLIAALTMLLYIFLGCPAFTPTQQFRREERANGVGPAEILDTISLEEYSYLYPYDQMIVAKSNYGATVFCYDSSDYMRNELTFREFDKGCVAFAVPSTASYILSTRKEIRIPIVAFDNLTSAYRAEMLIAIDFISDAGSFQKNYQLTAIREAEGYFLFTLYATNDRKLGLEGDALNQLVEMNVDDSNRVNSDVSVPVEISYYDRDDNLIVIKKFTMRSIVAEAKNP